MKKTVLGIIIFFTVIFVISSKNGNLLDLNKLFYYSFCDTPIKYKVDTVDKEFNLSAEKFEKYINEAVDIWEVSIDKNLFEFDPKGQLSINLIYDERQSLANKIILLEDTVNTDKQSLNPKVIEYEKQSADFQQKADQLNKQVEYWNNNGGAPSEEYKKIIEEQKILQAEADRLNSVAQSLNISTREYNSEVYKLNQTIGTFNNVLEERPEEGVFKGPENRIEIYFNISPTELVHTLAHELGHSLGLGHSQNKNAVMYFKTNQSVDLSKDDIQSLQEICKDRSMLELIQNYFIEIINKSTQLFSKFTQKA